MSTCHINGCARESNPSQDIIIRLLVKLSSACLHLSLGSGPRLPPWYVRESLLSGGKQQPFHTSVRTCSNIAIPLGSTTCLCVQVVCSLVTM